jgi:hypothetical protein
MAIQKTVFHQIGARALGYYGLMASYRRRSDGSGEPSVCITSCADTDENVHTPAPSVTISSRAGLLELREVINEALLQPDAESTGGNE